jgi:hypothetical protein
MSLRGRVLSYSGEVSRILLAMTKVLKGQNGRFGEELSVARVDRLYYNIFYGDGLSLMEFADVILLMIAICCSNSLMDSFSFCYAHISQLHGSS